jgi:hypothetical protein
VNGFDVIVFDTFPFTAKELRRNHFAFFATANGLLVRAGKLTYFKSALRCVRSITNIENSHNVNGPITGEIDALLVGRISSSRLNRTIRALITGC